MPYTLYDFVDLNETNEFRTWMDNLQPDQLGKLEQKLDMLTLHGEALVPHTLTDSPVPGIRKLRIHGNVQLRPLLCNGPIDHHNEYTLLFGAKEIGGRWSPRNAPSKAQERKDQVIQSPGERRKPHE